MITDFKNKKHKSREESNKITKTLNTTLKPVESIAFTGATSTSISLSIIGFGLIRLPRSADVAFIKKY